MENSKNLSKEVNPQKMAVSASPQGEAEKTNLPMGNGSGPMARKNLMVKDSPKSVTKSAAKEGGEGVMPLDLLVMVLSILFFPIYLLMQIFEILLAPMISLLFSFLESDARKKPKRSASLFSRLINLYGEWDSRLFTSNFSIRKSLSMVVIQKNRSRYSRFSNTTKYFVLMATPSAGDKMTVVAKLPKGIVKKISAIHTIYNTAATSASMIWPALFITGIQARIVTLDTAQTKIKALGKGQRDVILVKVLLDLDQLIAYVQTAVDANLTSAFSIADSCGLHIAGKGGNVVKEFTLTNGLTGVVLLEAAGSGDHTCHQWFYSLDNQVTWIQMTTTIHAEATKSGLTPGQYVWFNHQVIDANGPRDFEGAKRIMVK